MLENPINCSVTVMPICGERIGFIRRHKDDTYGDMLVAPGGKVKETDGEQVEGVNYYSVEKCAVRELEEETGIKLDHKELRYFCSLTLPNGRIVISLYAPVKTATDTMVFLTRDEIVARNDFAPGMKSEALLLADRLQL